MTIFLKNKHTLKVDDFNFNCCIGKNGVSKKKVEGDKKTPKGTFHIQYRWQTHSYKPSCTRSILYCYSFCTHT